jgi:signal transduction histidine kinase
MLLVSLTLGLTTVYLSLAVIVGFVVEDVIISKLITKHINYAEQYYQSQGKLPDLNLDFIQLYQDSSALPQELYEKIRQSTGDQEIFTPSKIHYHFRTLDLGTSNKGYIVAEVSDLLVVSQHPSIFTIYFIGLVLSLLLAVYLARKFSHQIVDPIMLLTKTVREGKIGKSSNSLPTFKYELEYLSSIFQKAFNELEQALEREKNFTTDVGHELRTPLTILKNHTALIEQRGYKESDLTEMKDVCLQMENTVTVLLSLARAESIDKQTCNVKVMLEQAILAQSNNGINITLNVDSQYSLTANPALLALLFNNLIANAFEHAQSQPLAIHQQQNSLTFENNTNHDLPLNAADSGVKSQNSKGVGQGLYLVTRIVESFGWHYQLSQNSRTFSFTIFPLISP